MAFFLSLLFLLVFPSVIFSENQPIPFVEGTKLGYVDASFTWTIPAKFEKATEFSAGKALVQQDGKFFVIGKKGEILFSLPFLRIGSFECRGKLILVEDEGRGFWLFNEKGKKLEGPFRVAFFISDSEIIIRTAESILERWDIQRSQKVKLPITVEGINDHWIFQRSSGSAIQVGESLYDFQGAPLSLAKDYPQFPRVMMVAKNWFVRWNGSWSLDDTVWAFFRWGETEPFYEIANLFIGLGLDTNGEDIVFEAYNKAYLFNVEEEKLTEYPLGPDMEYVKRGKFFLVVSRRNTLSGQYRLLNLKRQIILDGCDWFRDCGDAVIAYKPGYLFLVCQDKKQWVKPVSIECEQNNGFPGLSVLH